MAWAEAPAALLDLEQFGKGLESTYYEETYKDKPRLVTAFWASQLGSLMSLCVWQVKSLDFALSTLRNFGHMIDVEDTHCHPSTEQIVSC